MIICGKLNFYMSLTLNVTSVKSIQTTFQNCHTSQTTQSNTTAKLHPINHG